LLALAWQSLQPTAASAQQAVLRGEVIDSTTRAPVQGALVMVAGTGWSTTTDELGQFSLTGLTLGSHRLRVSHLAYGEMTVAVSLTADEPAVVRLSLSASAITLEPITVEVLGATEARNRAMGIRRNKVTREQIAALQNTNMTLADVLRHHVPNVRVRTQQNIVGSQICIELRTIRTSGVQPACLSPAVYLDGVPITNPTYLYGSLNLETLESLEVIPAAESGVRFGSGALYGALMIETRRPGNVAEPSSQGLRAFDWSRDPRPHPSSRAFVYSVIGNVIGLGVGMATARQCIGLRRPAEDAIITTCETWPTLGTATAAIMLPAIGGAIGAGIGGRTDLSRGQLLPATVGAVMALVPGYALALTSEREGSDVIGVIAAGLLTVGAPLATTLADRLFRRLR
jgi:hypothetical protein